MNKHTPAPWIMRPTATRPLSYRIIDAAQDGNGSICEIAHVYSRARAEADARLIAACPDLLEALKMCEIALRYINFDGELEGTFAIPAAQEAARAAIQKATTWTASEILKREG